MKHFLLFIVMFTSAVAWAQSQDDVDGQPMPPPQIELLQGQRLVQVNCQSSHEFIATLAYLRDKKVLHLDENSDELVAYKVAQGCNGSAQRFINSFEFLAKMKIGSRDALQISIALAHKSDPYYQTFIGVFARAYAKDKLNLDLVNSLQIAQAMSLSYSGDVEKGLNDFAQITAFCSRSALALSKPRCAKLGVAVAKAGEKFKEPVAPVFKKTFEFLHKELRTDMAESLLIAYEVASISPYAFDNFKKAYDYALQSTGLNLPARGALQFAMTMSKHSLKDIAPGTQEWSRSIAQVLNEARRLPASEDHP